MAAAKRYSAGTIFLQVSPVFRRFQEEVQSYVKDIDRALGDDMEKAGDRAGQRAGRAMGKSMSEEGRRASEDYAGHFETSIKRFVRNAEKEIGRLDLSTASEKMLKDLDEAKKKLRDLNDQDFSIDFDSKKVMADLARVQTAVEAISKGDHELNFDSNIARVLAEVKGALAYIDKEVKRKHQIDIDVATGAAERKMGAFERKIKTTMSRAASHLDGSINPKVKALGDELERLGKLRVGVDISATRLRAEAETIMRELKQIADTDVEIDARFDAGRAYAEMEAFERALDHVDGRTVRVHAVANTANAQRGLFGVARSGDDAANSFRSFSAILLAAVTLGPALVPVLGAIAGGLLAIGPAAAVAAFGLGAVLVGFSGLGNALTTYDALQKQQGLNAQTAGKQNQAAGYAIKDAAQAVADAERNAARAAADAARRVADARRSAADAVEAALERQKNAQEAYAQSVQDVRDAEQALAEARKAAQGQGADIKEKISDNARAQDQALLDVFNATVTNNAVQSDGSATNAEKEQARINLENARDALDDLRKEGKKLAEEQKKWRKEGVNGTDEVQAAQDRLNQALDAQKDAYQAVRDAAADVDQARAEGARQVADAIRAQNETLADNARAVQRAKENLDRARKASDDLNESVNSQANAFQYAMSQLSPAGRKFARFLIGLKEDFRAFRADIQAAMLPSIQEAIEGFIGSKSGSVVRRALVNLSAGFGEFAKLLSTSLQGDQWLAFFQMLADLGPDIQAAYGRAFVSFLEAMASILTTLAPYALDFANAFADLMDSFAGWAASQEGQQSLQRFMDHMKEIAPSVLELVGALAAALTNVLVALEPYSEVILGLLTAFLDMIAGMDPDTLAAVLTTVLVLITASQIAYAVMNLLLAGTALLSSAIGLLVFTFIGFALAIYFVYQQNHTLGIALGILVGGIYAAIIAFRIYRGIIGLVALAKFGYATATTGATIATKGLTTAQKIAMAVGRAYAAVQTGLRALMASSIVMTLRQRAATVASFVAQKAIAVATRAWAAAQFLLNAAMRLNPLGIALTAILAIAAGMVWAYKHFEGFRKVVDTVVNFVKDAFFGLWDFLFGHSVMPDIIDGMEWFFDRLSEIFGWIKTKVIDPLAQAFEWLWKNVIKPVLGFIIAYYKFVFKAMVTIWKNVLWPVLKVIGKVVWTLWKAYFKVAFTLIKAYFKTVFLAMKLVWEKVLHPVFQVIGRVVGWLWKNVFEPTLGWIGRKFGDVFAGMKVVWDRVLKPVFDFIGDKALPKLKGAFETAVDGIKRVWEGLKKVVAAPIRFVLDTVINKGLIAGFNKVAGWVNMDGFNEIDIPDSIAKYATGGIMPGYTPGRDVHAFYSPTAGRLELSGGEAVMRPEWTQAVGSGFVNQMNAIARNKGVKGIRQAMGMGGYWMGGVLPFPGASVSSHGSMYGHPAFDLNYPGYADYGQHVGAWKAGRVAQMNYIGDDSYGRWVVLNHESNQSTLYAHLSAFAEGLKTGMRVAAGQWIGNVGDLGNTGTPPTSHLHFEIMGGNVDYSDISASGSANVGGGRSVPGFIKDLLLHPIDTVKGWATSQFGKASDFITGTPVWDTLKNVPAKLAVGFGEKAYDILPGWAKSTVGAAADFAGAVGDVAGSVGGAVKDGIGAGLDAIGLAEGGILPYNGTMMYDNGGYLPPGLTSVVNLTGKPEPVFTNDQWAQMDGGTGGAGNIHYEPHFEGSDLTAADVAGDLNFQFRKIRRAGRYEGVGRP